MEPLIPVINSAGAAQDLPISFIVQHQHHFNLHFNKRGHLRSAQWKRRLSLAPLSNNGESFEQRLPDGHSAWALKGVRGSGRSAAA